HMTLLAVWIRPPPEFVPHRRPRAHDSASSPNPRSKRSRRGQRERDDVCSAALFERARGRMKRRAGRSDVIDEEDPPTLDDTRRHAPKGSSDIRGAAKPVEVRLRRCVTDTL